MAAAPLPEPYSRGEGAPAVDADVGGTSGAVDAGRAIRLKSVEFRKERERTWLDLERLVGKVDREGIARLTAPELSRLPALYRATVSSLSVARAISLDRNVVAYLESLAARAYFCVYGPKRRLRDALREFLSVRFPAVVRRLKWHIAAAGAVLVLGTVAGLALTLADPERFDAFVGEEMAQGRGPAASTEELRQVLYRSEGAVTVLTLFATFLFTHNARIGMLCFALGFAAGLPAFILLLLNGLMLGAFAALYQGRGLAVEFWAWVLPHGVTEMLAVVLCGGAGFAVAERLVFPGRHGRLASLAEGGREAGVVAIGAVLLFFVAGLIEGLFRQLVSNVGLRYLVVVVTTAFWIAYFGLSGRGRER